MFDENDRFHEENYITSLMLPFSPDKKMLYSSKGDDSYIDAYGGKSLYISGTCIRNSDYAIIDKVSCLLFFPEGKPLHLLTTPFIMNTKTFEPIKLDRLIKKGVITDRDYIRKIEETLSQKFWYSREKEYRTISAYGGLPEYIHMLRGFQEHIRETAMIKNIGEKN